MALSITGVTIAERKACMLENGIMSDCCFVVGKAKTNIPAHRAVLVAASPVIEKMFCKMFKEHDGVISIPEEDKLTDAESAVRTLLKYVYLGELKLNGVEEAMDVYKLANYFEIIEAEKSCETFLANHIYPSNVCKVYEFNNLYNLQPLVDRCLKIFSEQTKEVINNDTFSEIHLSTLLDILDLDKLNIDTEVQLIEPVYKWAQAECKRKGITHFSQEYFFSVCDSAIKKIRFLTMTPNEFASNVIINRILLSKEDCLAVLNNLCTPSPVYSLPDSVSKTKASRIKFHTSRKASRISDQNVYSEKNSIK